MEAIRNFNCIQNYSQPQAKKTNIEQKASQSCNDNVISSKYPIPFLGRVTVDFTQIKVNTPLNPGTKATISPDCQIILDRDCTIDLRNKNILEILDKQGSVVVGSDDKSCDIVISNSPPTNAATKFPFYENMAQQHLRLEKKGNTITAENISDHHRVLIVPKNQIRPFYQGVENIAIAQSGDIGDCFLCTSLYSLSLKPKGQEILKKMVRVDENGNYIVNFPTVIHPEEIDGQQTSHGKYKSISGDLGIKAIERAYAKRHKGEFGASVASLSIYDNGGNFATAMDTLIGKKGYYLMPYNKGFEYTAGACALFFNQKNPVEGMLNFLSNFDLKDTIVNFGTKSISEGFTKDSNNILEDGHAFAIKSINRDKRTVDVVNPHNTRVTSTISWEDFCERTHHIHIVNLDENSMLEKHMQKLFEDGVKQKKTN